MNIVGTIARRAGSVALAVLAALAVLTACQAQPRYEEAHYARKLEALRGRPVDDVKRAWGPAEAEDRLTDGTRLVRFQRLMPAFLAPIRCTTTFEVDPGGRIVAARYEGPGCRVRPQDDLGLGLP